MEIPNSPEQLAALKGVESLKELFGDELKQFTPFESKLVNLLHNELVQGEVTVNSLHNGLDLYLSYWSRLTMIQLNLVEHTMEQSDEVTNEQINLLTFISTLYQYLHTLSHTTDSIPKVDVTDPSLDIRYVLRTPET